VIETAAANDAPPDPAVPPVDIAPDAAAPGDARVATVRGEALLEMPADLYIPPDALEVFFDTFEGPLDLSSI
jgi:segregation and condensation protein A